MNKRIFALLLAALLILIASGCSKKQALPEQTKSDILATTQPVYQLANALTDGTGLAVSLLISEPVSCLHDYTLTVAQMEKIEGAQLVLESGLGLEDFMEDALSGKTRIDIFDEKLSDLQAYGDEALANLSCRELVTFHDGFSYFADTFCLTIAAAMEVESGSEPSAMELESIIAIAKEDRIPAVFTETNGETGSAEVVANETGCSVWTLDMAISSGDYFAAMRGNIDIVKEALG